MAQSPAHQFGQIIGETLESAIEPLLLEFAKRHALFLDKKGKRAARYGKKVSWVDRYENVHDLDFVLERDGTEDKIGKPIAFIEVAWRRYTKHSRNKAQEIQGAILPLRETYRQSLPFLGAVLAGVFTDGALQQLRSLGFSVIYFPYKTVIAAFKSAGIHADFNESTADEEFRQEILKWRALSKPKQRAIAQKLAKANQGEIAQFLSALAKAVERRIIRVIVLPLHGTQIECQTVSEAMESIINYAEQMANSALVRYEIEIQYSNGDRIRAEFEARQSALQFLQSYSLES